MVDQPAQEGRLIPGTGAHFQHPLFARQLQRLEISGVCGRLGYGLAAPYGEGRVFVRHTQ